MSRQKQKSMLDYFKSPTQPIVRKQRQRRRSEQESDEDSDVSLVGRLTLAPSSQPQPSTNESDDDEQPLQSSPFRRRPLATSSHSASDASSDDDTPINLLRQKRKVNTIVDSDEEEVPRKKRILKRGLKPVADEEENLMDELDQHVVIKDKFRASKKSEFTKNLERRRRQRLGLPAEESSDEVSDEESDEDDEEVEEVEGQNGTRFKPFRGSKPATEQAETIREHSNSDVDNFIEEDDEEVPELPMQFSSNRAQPLATSFKIVFQLFVHVACQQPHLREELMQSRLESNNPTSEYLKNAIVQMEKTLSSIRDSQVASSLWTGEFRRALETFPEIEITDIGAQVYCDACRRNNAISTRHASLSGRPYKRLGFEPIDSLDDSEESGDSSSDSDSDDQEGKVPPGPFNLGQHCARRVALFHSFMHWELHLFQAISEEVDRTLAKRRRLRDNPDELVELLDSRGKVTMHWKDVQLMMEAAQSVEVRKKGEID